MTNFNANYYDGITSARTPVQVHQLGDNLHIFGDKLTLKVSIAKIRADSRIGSVVRRLGLPDGAQLQTDDQAAIAALFPNTKRLETLVHKLEQRWPYILLAIVAIIGFSWWSITDFLPSAANAVTAWVPINVDTVIGNQSLSTVDKTLCNPTHIDVERQQQLQADFARLVNGLNDGYSYRLEIRDCGGMGANAFALPGGAIVLTDSLIELAQNDEQIIAVLAHEIGHVKKRHGMRMALQGAGAAALITALAGDAVSITSLAAALPTLLLQTGYSREFETEADTYAFKRLKEIGVSPKYFAEILTLLEAKHADKAKLAADAKQDHSSESSGLDYISTHPNTGERISRALANQ